jgi:hypothetical protein
MTSIAAANPRSNQNSSLASQIVNGLDELTIGAASGALAGYAFKVIKPVGGAIFGLSATFAGAVADNLADRFSLHHTAAKTAVWALSFIASLGAGILAATAAGFPITVLGAVGMTLAMIVTSISVRCVISCAESCFSTRVNNT